MKKLCLLTLTLFLLAIPLRTQDAKSPKRQFQLKAESHQFWKVIPQDAKLEMLATGFGFTEGPVGILQGLFMSVTRNSIKFSASIQTATRKFSFRLAIRMATPTISSIASSIAPAICVPLSALPLTANTPHSRITSKERNSTAPTISSSVPMAQFISPILPWMSPQVKNRSSLSKAYIG